MATRPMTNKNDRQAPSAGRRERTGRQRPLYEEELYEEEQQDFQGFLERGNEQFRELVQDHEGRAVLAALALGFGIGLAIGYAVGGTSQHESSRWMDRVTAEGVGRKLMARLDQVLPEAITSRLHG